MEQTLKTYIIYEITCIDKNIEYSYVGSTLNFRSRKSQHKHSLTMLNNPSFNLNIYKFIRENGGWDNFEMRPLEEFKCETNTQSKIREQYWIDLKQSNLNSRKAFNTSSQYYIDNRDKFLDKATQYRNNNKTIIAEAQHEYYINNKDNLLNYQHQYQINNKTKISERKARTYICECGKSLTISHKSGHNKTINHQKYINELII
jgi:hypothetical protein